MTELSVEEAIASLRQKIADTKKVLDTMKKQTFVPKEVLVSKNAAWNFEGSIEVSSTQQPGAMKYSVYAFKHNTCYLFEGSLVVDKKTHEVCLYDGSSTCKTISKSGKKRAYVSSFYSLNISTNYSSRAERLFVDSVKPELLMLGGVFFTHNLKELFEAKSEYLTLTKHFALMQSVEHKFDQTVKQLFTVL